MTTEDVARGQDFYQGLLDAETRPVPPSLRVTSAGALEPAQIPPSCYFDPGMHRLEIERVWSRVWQMACREEQLAAVGDSIVYEIGDASLIVIRTTETEIHAFHNSCLHRGTQLRTKPGHVRQLRCPFHGFTWNIDGSLREIPCAWDFPDLDPASYRPPRGAGRHLGRVRLRQPRPLGSATAGVPAGPAGALRRVALGGPLPRRPRRAGTAVQLEGGARGVHRGLPHDGGPPAVAEDRGRLAVGVRRVRLPREPDDHRGRRRERASRGCRGRRDPQGDARRARRPRRSRLGRTRERYSASAFAAHCVPAPGATTPTSPMPRRSMASSISFSRISCRGLGFSPRSPTGSGPTVTTRTHASWTS